jgi:hypothetical protein
VSRHLEQAQRPAKRTGAVKQPPDPGIHFLAGLRPSEYVIAPWASEQLRARIQRNNTALAAQLHERDKQRHTRRAEPDAEPEAEP